VRAVSIDPVCLATLFAPNNPDFEETVHAGRIAQGGTIMVSRVIAWTFVFTSVILVGCAEDARPQNCVLPDTDCLLRQAVIGISAVRENITTWSRLLLWGQVVAAVSTLIASIIIALQNDSNLKWTRPIGLFVTALATGIAAFLASFNVSDNTTSLVDSMNKLAGIVNDFDKEIEILKGGAGAQEVKQRYHDDAEFRTKLINVTYDYLGKYHAEKAEMLKRGIATSKIKSKEAN
jgi:hypothetical protein